jgi:hypothetical protein
MQPQYGLFQEEEQQSLSAAGMGWFHFHGAGEPGSSSIKLLFLEALQNRMQVSQYPVLKGLPHMKLEASDQKGRPAFGSSLLIQRVQP